VSALAAGAKLTPAQRAVIERRLCAIIRSSILDPNDTATLDEIHDHVDVLNDPLAALAARLLEERDGYADKLRAVYDALDTMVVAFGGERLPAPADLSRAGRVGHPA
jgi:hypothetical protein